MIEILYYAFIFPLQSVLGFALESLFGAIKSYGLSIIILSILVNVFLLKLSKIAESKANKTNALKANCDSKIIEFKRVFKGAELQSYIRTLYKQRHYHPIFALSGLNGLALQVPFFIAVLFLLQDFEEIKGESFLWISDLSAPDSVFGIHLLPILMTAISLVNVWIVAKEKGARIQGIIIALIFLVLLYQMPSALVLYWTSNMAFSLIRAMIAKIKFGNSPLDKHSTDSLRESNNHSSLRGESMDSPKQSKPIVIFREQSDRRNHESKIDYHDFANAKSRNDKRNQTFFIFRKPLKIAVISLTAILALGLITTFSLMLYAKDNVQTAPLSFESLDKARIHFDKLDFLLRSSSISNVKLVDIVWDKAIDSTEIKVTGNAKRFVYFAYLDLEKGTNLGTITYTMDFTPLLKHILFYYVVILGTLLDIYLLICCLYKYQDSAVSHSQTYHKITNYTILCIAFLICVFTPYQLYNTDITQFDSTQTYSTLSALFGAFMLCSFIAIYAISFIPKRFFNFVAFLLSVILFSGIVHSFILVGDYGAMDHFILQKAPQKNPKQIFEFIIVVAFGIALVAFTLTKLMRVWQIAFATFFIVSGVNALQIIDKRIDSNKVAYESQSNDKTKPPYEDELFSYSKTHKNIVVIVLDSFTGSHMPYILEQFPRFKTQLDGFTLFPNTIGTTDSTIHSIATLIGGEHYSAYNMNKRKPNLAQEIDKAFISTANAFADNDFSVLLMAYVGTKVANIAKTNDNIFGIENSSDIFLDYYAHSEGLSDNVTKAKISTYHISISKILSFGAFKFVPQIFRGKIYKHGAWLIQGKTTILNTFSSIKYGANLYTTTHTINTNTTKPTFKFFHSYMTHLPYGMYFNNDKCEFFSDKSAWNDYPHKVKMNYPDETSHSILYQHYDTESCALKYLTNYISLLKMSKIYDNTQIFVVSDHSHVDNINIPIKQYGNGPDVLFLFKDFNTHGNLKIDNRLMANYDISSIFCENLPNGCPNVPPNILKNYPTNREIIHIKTTSGNLLRHKSNEWLIKRAYKIKNNIYDIQNWTDISYKIANIDR